MFRCELAIYSMRTGFWDCKLVGVVNCILVLLLKNYDEKVLSFLFCCFVLFKVLMMKVVELNFSKACCWSATRMIAVVL